MWQHTFTHTYIHIHINRHIYVHIHACMHMHTSIYTNIFHSMWTPQTSTRYVIGLMRKSSISLVQFIDSLSAKEGPILK